MPFLELAGRSTLKQLHRTVQRNLQRHYRQARQKSTSSPKPPGGSTAAPETPQRRTIPSAWAWIEPVANSAPFRAYGNMQKRSPLLTQWESSLVIYYLGDLSAQVVSTNVFVDGPYEPAGGLRAMVIASIISIPSYKWFLFLGDHFNVRSHWGSIAIKILISQIFFTPIFNSYFFGMQCLLSGQNWEETKQRVIETVPVSWKNSWKVWPAVTAFSFTYIRPQNRSVFGGVIAVFWQTYLSWLNKAAEARAQNLVQGAEHEEHKSKKKTAKNRPT